MPLNWSISALSALLKGICVSLVTRAKGHLFESELHQRQEGGFHSRPDSVAVTQQQDHEGIVTVLQHLKHLAVFPKTT